jgi:hypothetical protein
MGAFFVALLVHVLAAEVTSMTGQLVLRKAAYGKEWAVWTLRVSVTHPDGKRSQPAKTFK